VTPLEMEPATLQDRLKIRVKNIVVDGKRTHSVNGDLLIACSGTTNQTDGRTAGLT